MSKSHGEQTRKIGESIVARFKGVKEVNVFYDHGESALSEHVCQPTTYMGRRYGRDATLSGLDIVVIFKSNVILLVEIEESCARPKTILGDIFGVLLADKVRIKGRSYPMRDVILLIGLTVDKKSKVGDKMRRLERLIKAHLDGELSGANISKVRVISSIYSDLGRRIERLIRLEIGKKIKSISCSS